MTKIKFELEIDLSIQKEADAFFTFVNTLAGKNGSTSPIETKEETQQEPPASKKKPSGGSKKSGAKKPVETKEEKTDEGGTEEKTDTSASEVSLEDLRVTLREKVGNHRDALKSKLTELGAPNISNLDPSKYEEFSNFMKDLK